MMPVMMVVVQISGRRAVHGAKDSGDPIRGRALRCNPCRLHSLRSFRASLGRRLAALTAVCPTADANATFTGVVRPVAAEVSCSRFAHRSSHFVLRRCRLRLAPGCAPRPALVSARVRTLSPPPPAACCARLACGSRRTARHSLAVAAPLRRLRRLRFPLRWFSRFGRPDRPALSLTPDASLMHFLPVSAIA